MWRNRFIFQAPEGDGNAAASGGSQDTVAGGSGQDTTPGGSGQDTTPGGGGQTTVVGGGQGRQQVDNKTGAEGAGGKEGQGSQGDQGAWPTIQKAWAKGDAKRAELIGRYSSVDAALDALVDAKQRIARGDTRKELPTNATAEQKAQWRKENGIPESPDKYELKLESGRVVGDYDKPLLDKFLKRMHNKNASPTYVNEAVNAYYEMREEEVKEREALDNSQKREAEDGLRREYGVDGFNRNMNLIGGMLDMVGQQTLKDKLFSARMPDGTVLGNDPEVIKAFVQLAYEINPTGTLMPGGGDISLANIDKEIAELVKLSGDTNSDYWKGPMAAQKQARLLELNTIKEKLAARGRQAA